ncbi:hypothetical protein [Yoonia sp. SS1-5]|uniref:Uncharacterized protein n=1 Tax=Yoonia rhodophyticola TaxID=3137370 RepID=A0AAN0MDT3_9RHOB
MLSAQTYRRIYRASAWYDIIVTWPYALPITFTLIWGGFGGLHDMAGLTPLPQLNPMMVLFANFFGTVVLIWSVVRLRFDNPLLGRYDAAGRMLFSAWMINALLHGGSPVIWVFLITEICWGIAQALPVRSPVVARV